MSPGDIERRVAGYYSGKLAEHGTTPRGVDWNSEESQKLRFQQFMPLVPADGRVSVLDFGCGYAAFAEHLADAGVKADYTGYDISPEMVEAARSLQGRRPDRTFTTDRGGLQPADVVVASGIFNVLAGTDRGAWVEYVAETLRELASLSRHGLAFNMLTSYSDADRMVDRLFYGDPCHYFDWCKRNLSRHVALMHDYGLYEFTILVRFDA